MDVLPILIVDDEKNIRLTVSNALEPLNIPVYTAINGEEALNKLEAKQFGIVFLDLKMPGMDGMDVLRHIESKWPGTRVVIITAHGTIESSVEAMKLGAVDFIQKPFSPVQIREIVTRLRERDELVEESITDYYDQLELAKRHMNDRNLSAAHENTRKAIAMDPGKSEAYNLLGILYEIKHENLEAQKFYRAALDINPTYTPARVNLERLTSFPSVGKIDFGTDTKEAR